MERHPPRDPATGQLRGDLERFPSGMKALGDYIHSKGIKYAMCEVTAQSQHSYSSVTAQSPHSHRTATAQSPHSHHTVTAQSQHRASTEQGQTDAELCTANTRHLPAPVHSAPAHARRLTHMPVFCCGATVPLPILPQPLLADTAESPTTCAGYPASANHEQLDAATFADWGVDYLYS